MLLPVNDKLTLDKAFQQYFEIVPALSDTLRDHVYRIRHQVYCEDLAYEPLRPDGRESDEYDAHSIHVLIRSVKTGEFIGCTRIIRARPEDPQYPLPFEKLCKTTLDRSIVDPARLPRDTIAEVSRLAVIAQFRKRKGEEKSPVSLSDQDFGTSERPRFPYIPVSLYLAATELARLNGIEVCFVLTEERLASHFRKIGFEPQTIGAAIEHRGKRIPSMMSPTAVIKNLRMILRPLYHTVAAQVAQKR
jgi:N-acyl amino acid synthase of PEP-CTERM/exosortase system